MSRPLRWLNAALLALALYLGFQVWRQHGERARWQHESARLRQIAASAAVTAGPPATTRASAPTTTPVTPASENSAVDAAARDDEQRVANRAEQMFRRNALTSYIAGFEPLQLPPDKLARAKEIILARSHAAQNARQSVRSMDELFAAAAAMDRAMDEQMTALLGPHDNEILRAGKREDSLDWTIGTDMWDGGAPLQPGQLPALAQAYEQVKFEPPSPWASPNEAQTPDPQTGLSRQDTTLLAATARSLSPSQQEILRKSLIEENQYNAAMRAFSEKQRQLWQAAK